LLDDTLRACQRICEYTQDLSLDDYKQNQLVHDAVERNLLIVGEALSRLDRVDSETASRITNMGRITGLRNRLAHGYEDDINDDIIWNTIRTHVPALLTEVELLLAEA